MTCEAGSGGVHVKKCSGCKKAKPTVEFSRDATHKDGLRSRCKECMLEYRLTHKPRIAEVQAASKNKNRSKVSEYNAAYYRLNKERRAVQRAKNKERIAAQRAQYMRDNPDKVNARTAKHRAAKRGATPKWLTRTHHAMIGWFYAAAKMMTETTGTPHQVDHVFPLDNKDFCGLHVPWNLQVLTSAGNAKKCNRPPESERRFLWENMQ